MRILTIDGSQKKRPGFTSTLLDALARGARAEGAEVAAIRLADLEIRPCIACGACQKSGSGRCERLPEDGAEPVFAAMRRADIVVFGSPIYIFSPSSSLKALLERYYALGPESGHIVSAGGLFFHPTDRAVCGKPFVLILSADNLEWETMRPSVEYFKTFSRFMDAPLRGILYRGAGKLIRSGSGLFGIEEALKPFERAGRELALGGRVSRRTEREAARSPLPISPWLFALLKRFPAGRKILLERAASIA